MIIKKIMLMFAMLVFVGGASFAQHKYIGVKKCKMCHNNPAKGEQFNKWSNANHSKAFTVLSSDKAKEIASKHDIADATTDAECLKCHSTTGSVDKSLHEGIKVEEGVSCESCHGPGSTYKSATIMKSKEKSIENGLIIPNEELCKKCHEGENKYHDMEAFDYVKASEAIAHPNPKKK